MELKDKASLDLRRIAEEWSREPATLTYDDIFTRLLSAFWKGEFVGEDAPDRHATLNILKYLDAVPYQYWDDEDPPADDYAFLANLPGDGYDNPAPECYDEAALSVLLGLELSKATLEIWCDANEITKPNFWFEKSSKSATTGKAIKDCRRWLAEQVEKPKAGAKAYYWITAKALFPTLSRRAFDDIWRITVPDNWKLRGAPTKDLN